MAKQSDRLEALKKKQDQLKAQIAALEAKAKQQERKDDTRLKIIIGAAVMADSVLHPATATLLADILARAVKADRDREFLQSKGWLNTPSNDE